MIDILVIRLRVEYFLFGDRLIRELKLPRHSLTALVMHGAAVHSMYCLKGGSALDLGFTTVFNHNKASFDPASA